MRKEKDIFSKVHYSICMLTEQPWNNAFLMQRSIFPFPELGQIKISKYLGLLIEKYKGYRLVP